MTSEEAGVEHPLILRQMMDEHVAVERAMHGRHGGFGRKWFALKLFQCRFVAVDLGARR